MTPSRTSTASLLPAKTQTDKMAPVAEEGAATLPPGLAGGGSGSGAVRVGGAPLNIADGVRKISRASRNRIAVVGGDRSLTYGALKEHSSRLGCALLARGLSPGQPVAVLLGNRLEKDGRRLGKGGVHAPRETATPSMRALKGTRLLHYREYGNAGFYPEAPARPLGRRRHLSGPRATSGCVSLFQPLPPGTVPRADGRPLSSVVNSSVARAERTDDLADPACCQILGDPALMSED